MAQFRREGPSPEFVVGLLLQTGQSHMRGVIKGVYRFLRVNPHWRIEGYGHHPLLQWDQLASWRGDGLIGIPENPSQLEQLLDLGVPVVNAGSRFIDKRITTVACDSEAIGREAAEHLLAVGLKHFLFLSELTWENERQRYRAFDKAITQAGFRCDLLPIPSPGVAVPGCFGPIRPGPRATAGQSGTGAEARGCLHPQRRHVEVRRRGGHRQRFRRAG